MVDAPFCQASPVPLPKPATPATVVTVVAAEALEPATPTAPAIPAVRKVKPIIPAVYPTPFVISLTLLKNKLLLFNHLPRELFS